MTTLDASTLDRLSLLAKLAVEKDQHAKLTHDLSAIVGFIDKLSEADTEQATPLHTTLELTQNPVNQREDIITEPDQRDTLQALAPDVADGLYLVPEVLD